MPCDLGHYHPWPASGLLRIWPCERYCGYCIGTHREGKRHGSSSALREHAVCRIHKNDYPEVVVQKGDNCAFDPNNPLYIGEHPSIIGSIDTPLGHGHSSFPRSTSPSSKTVSNAHYGTTPIGTSFASTNTANGLLDNNNINNNNIANGLLINGSIAGLIPSTVITFPPLPTTNNIDNPDQGQPQIADVAAEAQVDAETPPLDPHVEQSFRDAVKAQMSLARATGFTDREIQRGVMGAVGQFFGVGVTVAKAQEVESPQKEKEERSPNGGKEGGGGGGGKRKRTWEDFDAAEEREESGERGRKRRAASIPLP
ncbi:hypothetical protein LTS18_005931 [Coniosporium uncinatum]|uniref:Uncharacterized protein n=1 Tax=Coniosporium uncinatum TaxID=93489 RepID=A0ACC3DQQ0_9PEZI|nr:hypothetical protein LTS18_005931 [Coniosporium uncinatum]